MYLCALSLQIDYKMSGIYNCSLINFTFCCEQCRTMTIIHFADISNYLFFKHYQLCMHFPDTADKKKEDVKEAGELKAENVNKGNGTDGAKPESVKDPGELKGDTVKNAGIYNYSLINFTFCCLQCRRMRIILFQIFQIIYFANINNYICIFQTQQTRRRRM